MTAVAPLRIGQFRSLWVSSVFSNLGSFFYTVAASWLMLELTGSATWVGLMQAANTLPLLFLALTAGAVADMVDRTKVMLASQILMGAAAGAMAVLSWLDLITPGWLLALGLLIGVGVAFNLPAWQALVPNLVPRGLLPSAVALNSAGFNVARAVGPALGGILVATAGPSVAFGINALSFAGVIVAVAAIGRHLTAPEPDTASMSTAIALGIRFARFTPSFRRLLALLALFAVTSAVIQSVLPSRTDELGGDADTYGLLLGSMGIGALLAAFGRARIMHRLGTRATAATIAAFGLSGVLAGLAPTVLLTAIGLVLAGACWVLTLVTLNATSQTLTPEWIRGRAMGLYTLAFTGILPIGAVVGGAIGDLIGPGRSMAVLSVGTVVLGLATPLFRIPDLDEIEAPEFTEDRPSAHRLAELEGGPVMIVNTWTIDEDDYGEFLAAMSRVRLVRLSTGAYRWRLYRNVGHPERFTEVFLTHSWDEHIAQHRRIDDASAALIRAARALDREGDPRSNHLLAVDTEDPPGWAELLLAHEQLHRTDGSIPLDDE